MGSEWAWRETDQQPPPRADVKNALDPTPPNSPHVPHSCGNVRA